jgi:hypothetical protein
MDEEQQLLTFSCSPILFQFVHIEKMKRSPWLYILGTTVHLSTQSTEGVVDFQVTTRL